MKRRQTVIVQTMGRPSRTTADRALMRQMGKRLLWVRQAHGISQQAMADMAGVHQTAWSLYERGRRWPDEFAAMRLIAKLKITRAYLLEGDLSGVEPGLAIRLAASHPELVFPTGTGRDRDKGRA